MRASSSWANSEVRRQDVSKYQILSCESNPPTPNLWSSAMGHRDNRLQLELSRANWKQFPSGGTAAAGEEQATGGDGCGKRDLQDVVPLVGVARLDIR
jgi:hypothetical protein